VSVYKRSPIEGHEDNRQPAHRKESNGDMRRVACVKESSFHTPHSVPKASFLSAGFLSDDRSIVWTFVHGEEPVSNYYLLGSLSEGWSN